MRRVAILAWLMLAAPAWGAEVSCVAEAASASVPAGFYPSGRLPAETNCVAAQLAGPIRAGDAAALKNLLAANWPFLADLYLNSPGGDAAEAMRIGALVRRLRLAVSAPFDSPRQGESELLAVTGATVFELCSDRPEACGCAGACVLVWAAGGRRNGDTLRPLAATPTIQDFLTKMEAPPVLRAGGAGWIATNSVADAQYPASIAAWLAATCGSYSNAERDALLRDVAVSRSGRTTEEAASRLAREHETISTVQYCRDRMFARYRDETRP